jgi:plastocyanin
LKATADEDIPPKGKVRLDVTFPVSGARAFFCKFHGPVGMNGQLLIGDTAPSGPR